MSDIETESLMRELAEHRLEVVCDTERVKSFYLKKPGTRMMSCLITFTPEGIAIQGDLTPEHNGSVSCMGYGVEWFAGRKSDCYLCEKFLRKRWVQSIAQAELRDPKSYLREDATPERLEELDDLADGLDEHGSEWLYSEMIDLGYDTESVPGDGYDPNEARVLIVIQRRFAELYAEMKVGAA